MVSTGRRHGPEEIYEATKAFVAHGLLADGSAFTPGKPVWTADNFAALKVQFVDRPDTGSDSFSDKLRRQLAGCSAEQIQLMAELMYVHLLINSITSGAKKRETINEVLSLIEGVEIPDDLAEAQDHGALNPGTFFNTRRDLQLSFLVRFGVVWKALPSARREQAIRDPWTFDEILDTVELESAFTQKESLKHLVHPDAFEAISSQEHKKRIIGALGDLVGEVEHPDRKIALIREALTPILGEEFDFYFGGEHLWRTRGWAWPETVRWATDILSIPSFLADEVDYKVEGAARLRDALETFMADGTTQGLSSRLSKNGLTNGIAASMWVEWAAANRDAATEAVRAAWSDEGTPGDRVDAFLADLSSEKLSGTGSRATVAATVMLAHNPDDHPIFRVRAFEAFAKLVGADKAPKNATSGGLYDWALGLLDGLADHIELRSDRRPSRLECQGLVFVLTTWEPGAPQPDHWTERDVEDFLAWRGRVVPADADEDVELPEVAEAVDGGSSKPPAPRHETLAQVADRLHLDPAWMRRLVTLLEHRPQLVLQGPPGTGKTYVALALAEHLAGSRAGVSLVQFHASYAYEDFVQGWRPDGEGFALMPGPLLRMAAKAEADPAGTYVMVIDELNRGDVAKVFGELFFLLENRGKAVELQYDSRPFALPHNLKFIATMNTADRSIAIVDGALRRRFHFVDFTPAKAPVDALLRSWLARHKTSMEWVADVVDAANEMLDEDLAIGPSHFLDENLDDDLVELAWDHSVLPYVREQMFGRLTDFSAFSLDVLRAKVEASADGDADAD